MSHIRPPHQAARPLTVAVPELTSYSPKSGIGRVFSNLQKAWQGEVQLIEAHYRRLPLPLARDLPFAVATRPESDVIFLPRMLGSTALGRTGKVPSLMVVHDVGGMEKQVSGDVSVNRVTAYIVNRHFWAIRHASHVVAVSHFTKARLLHHVPELANRVSVIHNGVEPDFLHPSPPREAALSRIAGLLGQPLGQPLLVYVGSESPRKNIPLLLEVFRALKARFPNAQLIKVGQPDHVSFRQHTQQALERTGLRPEHDVLLRNTVSDEELKLLYLAADVFVSTSLYEGFGLPALEAMALGTPVVVTNRGAFPEIVQQGGLLVEPTREAFLTALTHLLNDDRRAWWVARAKDQAARYSWTNAAAGYLSLMTRLAARATTPRFRPPLNHRAPRNRSL